MPLATQDARTRPLHHELPVHEVVLLLETHPARGLAGEEASRRLAEVGPDALPWVARRGPALRFLLQFQQPGRGAWPLAGSARSSPT
jgi:cation-transporting P-type ATPase F